MKKTQLKDARRNIIKQTVSYLSVIVIAMLAVLAFLGINFASKAIDENANSFYDDTHFRDIQIASNKLVTPEDLEVIRSVQGVSDAEGVYRTDAMIFEGEKPTDVLVVSLTGRINVVELIDGRLPSSVNECIIEKSIDDDTGLKIGDTVEVRNSKGGTPDYLSVSEYVITGIVFHPDHSCWPLMTPGPRYVLVMPDAFDKEALEDCFMTAEILVDGAQGLDRFGTKYLKTVEEVTARLDVVAKERELIRYNDILGRYQSGIDEEQAELDDAAASLADGRAELDSNWKDYNEGVSDLNDAQKQLTDTEKKLSEAEAELKEAKELLDEAEAELKTAKTELDSGWAELEDARSQLGQAGEELDDAREQLESGYEQIEDAKTKIRKALKRAVTDVLGSDIAGRIDWSESSYGVDVDDPDASATFLRVAGGVTIDLNRSMLSNIFSLISSLGIPEHELKEAYERTTGRILELSDGDSVLSAVVEAVADEYGSINSEYQKFAAAAHMWDSSHDEYIRGLNDYYEAESEYEDGLSRYYDGFSRYEDKLAEYNNGLAEYEEGLDEYNKSLAAYEEGKKQYAAGEKELDNALTELENGESEYSKGVNEYNEGVEQLEEAIADMKLLDACRWIILDVEGNAGYLCINNGRKNVSDLGITFALIFILVGALVIYATVGRIVDEQRQLVGATKALGLYNREILTKYLIFGVSGTLSGMILGLILGYFAIQRVVLSIYGRYYIFGAGKSAIDIPLTSVVFAGGLILSGLTVWRACAALMRSSAITLMQESVPEIKRKSKKVRKGAKTGKGSLYAHLIINNMLSDKKRVAVTIAGIAGCCSLLVAGMTMNFGVKKTIDEQFSEIEVYDLKITFNSSISGDAESEIEKILADKGVSYICISDSMTVYDANRKLSSCELLCGDIGRLNDFFHRRDPKTYSLLTDPGDGIWIHAQNAKKSDLNTGDQITIYDPAMKPYQSKVTGIFENRVGLYAVMDRSVYISIFDKEPVNNTFLVLLNGVPAEDISSLVSTVNGVTGTQDVQQLYDEIKSLAVVLDYLSILFIGIAGMMAFFILLNLVNMYIHQKKKELTIMRINGFTVKETIRYVSMEIIVSNVIGILIGLVLGSALGYRIITLLEGSDLHIIKSVQIEAWGIAALITTVFSLLISALALRKVKHLKLNDMT